MSDLDDLEEFSHLPDLEGWTKPGTCNRLKTHCKNGHPFDEKNTIRTKNGRKCRACHIISMRRRVRERLACDPAFKERHNIQKRDSMRRLRARRNSVT